MSLLNEEKRFAFNHTDWDYWFKIEKWNIHNKILVNQIFSQ